MTSVSPDIRSLAEAYLTAKEYLVATGYAPEIDWQEDLSTDLVDESYFLREAAWVVLCCGMRETVVRLKFPEISRAFVDWESADQILAQRERCRSAALTVFCHEGKIDAIIEIAASVGSGQFPSWWQKVRTDPLRLLSDLPYIGPVTRRHLAKNLGFGTPKADRHLQRIAEATYYADVYTLCRDLAEYLDEKEEVVDIVLWRFATLRPNYENFFAQYVVARTESTPTVLSAVRAFSSATITPLPAQRG